jgi:N utilization substance protein B
MIVKKRKSRELAMQVLFLWDTHGADDADNAAQAMRDSRADAAAQSLAMEMARGAWDGRALADRWMERVAPQWPPRRQPAVDRNILRLAIWELTNTLTPPKVVIDEAIELAKAFSTEQSAAFVNGVLDAVLKEHESVVRGPLSVVREETISGTDHGQRTTDNDP